MTQYKAKSIINYARIAAALTIAAAIMITGCKPTVTADTTPPAEVTELSATGGNGKVSLSWKNPGDADLYQVEISAEPAAGSLSIPVYLDAVKGAEGSYTVTGLANGTAYTFTVKTIDKSLNKSKGVKTESSVTPQDTSDKTPPKEVTDLTVTGGNGKVSLSWKNPADGDLEQVKISVVKKDNAAAVKTVYINAEAGKDGSTIVGDLEGDTDYTVTVVTIDKSGNKSKGISKSAKTNPSGAVMRIKLTQNPAEETWTKGAVTVTVASSTSMNVAKWMKGAKSASEVLKKGNAITGNSFEVTENGMYSVAVQDNDGRREVETIVIKNIDKTPPAPVTGLTAAYSSTNKTITVGWKNPTAPDFAGLTLKWKKGTGNETEETLGKDKESYVIENIESDGGEYTITIKAKDDVGNESSAETISVTATTTAEITNVTLNRTHLDTKQSDRDIHVTVSGSNFDKLTSLLVQVMDGSSSAVPAHIDAAHNTATATVSAPPGLGTYTVKVIVNSTTPSDKTATFKVTEPARVNKITLSKNPIAFGTQTTVKVTVEGTNFDIRGETQIKLFDSKNIEVSGSTVTVGTDEGMETEFSKEIMLPTEVGFYTVAVFFKGIRQSTTVPLQLYGAPEITGITIPKAGIGNGDNKIPVTITGKNFSAPKISFSGSGATFTDFKIESDTLATAAVVCPRAAGEHTVTVTCEASSKTGVLSVKDYSAYTVGKIVLADKTMKAKDDYTEVDPSNPPVGIICGLIYGVPKMIALHTSGADYFEWAKQGSTGYETEFKGIICTPSTLDSSGSAGTATFTRDTDGSDNWEYIKSQDPVGTVDAETNYPPFNWVNTYNTKYADKLGGANIAWYMPSLAELCEVYKNKATIDASFAKICSFLNGSDYADASLDTNRYWSSSQVERAHDVAWNVNFWNGSVDFNRKYIKCRVCCIAGL